MPGSPAFYNKISLWMREAALDVLHLSFNRVFSTVSHTILAPSSGCSSPHNKGGSKRGWVSRLSTVGRGWAGTILRVWSTTGIPALGTHLDRAAGQRDGQEPAELRREQGRGLPSQGRSPCSARLGAQTGKR